MTLRPCPVCGHSMPPQLVICWWCGYCLNPHIRELAKAAKEAKL